MLIRGGHAVRNLYAPLCRRRGDPLQATPSRPFSHRGFSLVEMAIVLVLLGLLLGGLMVPLSSTMKRKPITETEVKLALAQETLLGFAVIHGTLPYPDSDGDGMEDPGFHGEGRLPWATLGLTSIDGSDGWDRPLFYRGEWAFYSPPANPPDTASNLQVRDAAGRWTIGDPDALAAVVFSLGPDGVGNGENGDGDNRYEIGAYCVEGCNVYFDDQLIMMSKHLFVGRLAAVGKWP